MGSQHKKKIGHFKKVIGESRRGGQREHINKQEEIRERKKEEQQEKEKE